MTRAPAWSSPTSRRFGVRQSPATSCSPPFGLPREVRDEPARSVAALWLYGPCLRSVCERRRGAIHECPGRAVTGVAPAQRCGVHPRAQHRGDPPRDRTRTVGLLRDGTLVVNSARAWPMDEQALIEALRTRPLWA